MSAVDLMLPKHLYTENLDEQGEVSDVIYLHDRLINWFDHGRGVTALCQSVFDGELDRIAVWEESQMMLLEEQWLAVENGEEDDANEAQYHLACEAVAQEAGDRRRKATGERDQRHSAIEKLVQDCSVHLECNALPPAVSHATEYTMAIVAMAALAFILL